MELADDRTGAQVSRPLANATQIRAVYIAVTRQRRGN
jgi:hypothetical protein